MRNRAEKQIQGSSENTDTSRSSGFSPTSPLPVSPSALRRVFQLWGIYAYLDMMLMTRDLKTFVGYYISDFVLNVASISGMLLLAERFQGIGVWQKPQVIFLLGYALTVSALIGMFFNYNISHISRRVGRGQLDHVLIQPQPVWMALLTEGFLPFAASGMTLPGLGIMVWAGRSMALPVSAGWLGLVGLNLLASVAVVMSFSFLWGSLAFWEPRAAEEVNSSTMRLMEQLKPFPLDGLGRAAQLSLLTAMPVGFVAWLPCRALLGIQNGPWNAWLTPLAALLLVLSATWVFNRGMKHYAEIGSQRYLSFGHRK